MKNCVEKSTQARNCVGDFAADKAREYRGAECTKVHEHCRIRVATQSDGKSTSRKNPVTIARRSPCSISNTVVKLLSADDTWVKPPGKVGRCRFFYYLDLRMIEIKKLRTCASFYYLDLGKIERKNCARSVKHVRASFYLPKYFYYVGDIAWQYLRNIDKSTLRKSARMDECHMRIEISDFVMRAFVPIQRKDSSHAVFFHFGNVSTFRKGAFLRSSMRHRRKDERCTALTPLVRMG